MKITKKQKKAAKRAKLEKKEISMVATGSECIKASCGRVYFGKNPEYAVERDGVGRVINVIKTQKGIPYIREVI